MQKKQKFLLEDRIYFRCTRISTKITGFSAPMYKHRYGLSHAEMRVLAVVARYEPISPGDLSNYTAVDSSKTARAIGALVQQGYMTRTADDEDARRAVLRLTDKGRRVQADIESFAVAIEERIADALTPIQRKQLIELLRKVDEKVSNDLVWLDWQDLAGPPPK